MESLSDHIEKHLRNLLEQAEHGVLEIQRRELADQFECAPSQINYVLETRFTTRRGYVVETRRGGGGYIRIMQLSWQPAEELAGVIQREIGESLSQREAEHLLLRLVDAQLLNNRQAAMVRAALEQEVEKISVPFQDVLRALVLRAILTVLLERRG
ncbi:MAG: CtsR family transcriptional regulator [Firmicutes bacterium]|nr:CtsR family transcriptional regulator [Bacillota bacterium]